MADINRTIEFAGRETTRRKPAPHVKVVQELLGRSTISLTLDTYSHVAPALHAEVANHMQALFG